jgi:uncharacterized DUF497 family protein
MPPIIEEFWASTRAQHHMIVEHGVDLEDALDAAESTDRHYRASAGASEERRYIIPGKTSSGRRLWVAFAVEGGGRGRIITAREPAGRKERARHKRLRGD